MSESLRFDDQGPESDGIAAACRRSARRYFLGLGAAGAAAWYASSLAQPKRAFAADAAPSQSPEAADALAKLDPYFTPTADFRDVSRGKPVPHSLPEDKKREVGLTRDTWKLEVTSDPENKARLGKELTKADGTALDFKTLLTLGEKHAVRFPKVMTCLNIGCPLGTGVWEGVPLREVVKLAEPREDLRRVFYHGFHNDDPKQMFRSSLPIGRVLEDYFDLPPVILCYKLNGEWLDAERGGPVRVVVPEAYGFKSIKWLTNLVLTNLAHSNDTYAAQNNDVDSPLKSFAAVLTCPKVVRAGTPTAVTGYAQVGISGLSKVQISIESNDKPRPSGDPHFTTAPWRDAEVLGPPKHWGAVPEGRVPPGTQRFDAAGRPRSWPLRLAKVYWAALLPGLEPGEYSFRSRTVDERGHAQPQPRPMRKSGHAAIETVVMKVEA
mgnify:CR=1 FL=1